MNYFFPSFFANLSHEEILYLKENESWVLEIFGDFWNLLMKNFEDLGTPHIHNFKCFDVNHQSYSLGQTLPYLNPC
jgi:hypothetical protein